MGVEWGERRAAQLQREALIEVLNGKRAQELRRTAPSSAEVKNR